MQALIIDDSKVIQDLLASHLTSFGYTEILFAASQNDAMTKLGVSLPSIITLDINLESSNGFDCLDSIRLNYPEVPVLVISGSENRLDGLTALEKGALDFIKKPFTKEDLQYSISRISNETEGS